MVLYILSMSKLLEDYDNNIIEEDTNNICNCIDVVKNTTSREYIRDLIGYTLLTNKKYKLEIIENNEIKNKTTLNFEYYYNKTNKSYYLLYEEPFYLKTNKGHLEFIIKNNDNFIQKIGFTYVLNDPLFDMDVIKIQGKNYELFIYLKRANKNKDFHFYKIIFTLI
tara:strand:- start:173 stop:670 length:498 start_codon:yes stop_codon:yes gene_type:complete